MFGTNVESLCELSIFQFEKITKFSPYKTDNISKRTWLAQIYLWLPWMCRNCHLCSENDIFYNYHYAHHSMSIKKYFAATYIKGVTFVASGVSRSSTSLCWFFSTICKYNYYFMHSNIIFITMLHNVCKMHWKKMGMEHVELMKFRLVM